jgi:very-long-chain enoyl-CoA reductase
VDGKKSVYSDDLMPLNVAKVTNTTELALKNLGTQIKWNYVFYIEYAGPLIIFPLLFLLGHKADYNEIQYLALVMAIIHYVKR